MPLHLERTPAPATVAQRHERSGWVLNIAGIAGVLMATIIFTVAVLADQPAVYAIAFAPAVAGIGLAILGSLRFARADRLRAAAMRAN